MENNYFDSANFYKMCRNENSCNIVTHKPEKNPKCIDKDFCVASPENRNDGILTMAFVDMQTLESVYPQNKAFCNGTLFPNLNMPFYGGNLK